MCARPPPCRAWHTYMALPFPPLPSNSLFALECVGCRFAVGSLWSVSGAVRRNAGYQGYVNKRVAAFTVTLRCPRASPSEHTTPASSLPAAFSSPSTTLLLPSFPAPPSPRVTMKRLSMPKRPMNAHRNTYASWSTYSQISVFRRSVIVDNTPPMSSPSLQFEPAMMEETTTTNAVNPKRLEPKWLRCATDAADLLTIC